MMTKELYIYIHVRMTNLDESFLMRMIEKSQIWKHIVLLKGKMCPAVLFKYLINNRKINKINLLQHHNKKKVIGGLRKISTNAQYFHSQNWI